MRRKQTAGFALPGPVFLDMVAQRDNAPTNFPDLHPQLRIVRKTTMEILAFDTGVDIVGVFDLRTQTYTPYRGQNMTEGAKRVLECEGIIISFNGIEYDLPRLAKLVGTADPGSLPQCSEHFDMLIEASRHRWPPDEGSHPIWGTNLSKHYAHYFPEACPTPPAGLDGYEQDNWLDCYRTAELWNKICGKHNDDDRTN